MRSQLLAALVFAPLMAFASEKSFDISIDGMTCDPCVKSVTQALEKIPNVDKSSVKVVLKEKKATLALSKDDPAMEAKIKKAIEDAGFKVTSISATAPASASKEAKHN